MSERRRCRRRPAFTLIELIVVIGIIALLMSILIPTIGRVRVAGFDSATTHRMQALMTAIENYHQANGAYPGPLAENEVYSSTNPNAKAVNGANAGSLPTNVTSTENMTLGLLGGATVPLGSLNNGPSGGLTVNYDPNAVGNGAQSLNQLQQGQHYGPYADAKVCGLERSYPGSPNGVMYYAWNDPNHDPVPANHSIYTDTAIPEFTDAFPDPMPFLYVRAAGGSTAQVAIKGAPLPPGVQAPAGGPSAVWDPSQLQPYTFPAPQAATSGNPTAAQITNTDTYNNADPDVVSAFSTPHFYFTMADQVTPRQRGGYLLIAAGKDRKYMTHDDRINGSPAQ